MLDVRGTGAARMRKRTRRPTDGFESGGTEFRAASDLFMLGTSVLSARVFDVLRGFDALRARPDLPADAPIELVAAEFMAIYGLFAAVIETGFSPCRFINMLSTYDGVFHTLRQYAPNVVSQATLAPELAGRLGHPGPARSYSRSRQPYRGVDPPARAADGGELPCMTSAIHPA